MSETIPEDLMQAARKIGENLRFELAEIQFREAAALWGKPGVIEAMTASLSSVLMDERTRQEERVRVLEEALRPFANEASKLEQCSVSDRWRALVDAGPYIGENAFFAARAALGNGGGDA